jgi:hypothetical protein
LDTGGFRESSKFLERAVFPIPGSPLTRLTPPLPELASASASLSSDIWALLPTNGRPKARGDREFPAGAMFDEEDGAEAIWMLPERPRWDSIW